MTSIERIFTAGLMVGSAALGVTGAVYMRPLHQPEAPAVATMVMPTAHSIRTVSWFKAHKDEIKPKLSECNDNPGVAMHDPECINADDAASKLSFERELGEARAQGIIK